jgi:uncharacterized protein (DUF1800 family)
MTLREAAVAVNRFGLGARPGELDAAARDPRRWLLEQLEGPPTLPRQLQGFPGTREQLANYAYRYRTVAPDLNRRQREAKARGDQAAYDQLGRDIERMLTGYVAWVAELINIEWAARTNVALTTATPFRERLVRFWSNHLVVPAIKQPSTVLAGAYEREAIRPHVTGRFADMLRASAKNPGMLAFLDNTQSVGPNSPAAKQFSVGLNENLGREILELHTLGVEGGYTQADVIELALGITGWSAMHYMYGRALRGAQAQVDGPGPFGFAFYADWHEPGARTLLGKTYPAGGVGQGEQMLDDLARHPNTARFLATKLARHFTSDDPPQDLVQRMADAYLAKDTDLAEMTRVLVEADAPWEQALSKLKQPEDYVISALRTLDLTLASDRVPVPRLYDFDAYAANRMMWGDSTADASVLVGPLAPGGGGGAEMAGGMDNAMAGGAGTSNAMTGGAGAAGATMGSSAPAAAPGRPGFVRAAREVATLRGAIGAMGQRPMNAPGPQGWYDRAADWSGADSILKRIEWVFAAAEAHAGRVGDPRKFLASTLGALAPDTLTTEVARAATPTQGIALVLGSPQFQRR